MSKDRNRKKILILINIKNNNMQSQTVWEVTAPGISRIRYESETKNRILKKTDPKVPSLLSPAT